VKYRLNRSSGMYALWNALPFDQWVSAKEVQRLTVKMKQGTRHSALSALIARNLVKRRPSRANLNAYDYLRLPEDEAIEKPDGPPDGTITPTGEPDAMPREAGGTEPFVPLIKGSATTTDLPPMSVSHGTARCYMAGCADSRCLAAYQAIAREFGVESTP